MNINLREVSLNEKPCLVLKNASGTELFTLSCAYNIKLECNYNEISRLSFDCGYDWDWAVYFI